MRRRLAAWAVSPTSHDYFPCTQHGVPGAYDLIRTLEQTTYPIGRLAVLLYLLWRTGELKILGDRKLSWLADLALSIGAILISSLLVGLVYGIAYGGTSLMREGFPRRPLGSNADSGYGISACDSRVGGGLFRGYLIRRFEELFRNTFYAVATSCLLYALLFVPFSIANAVAEGLVGLIFALVFLKTNRLWPVIFAHFFVAMYGWFR